MILKILPESGVLRVIAAGEFSLEEARRTFLEILDAVAQQKAEKILFDGRELKGDPETMERFFYGEFAAQAVAKYTRQYGAPRAPQFAYVLQEPVLDPRRFGETVAVNRGMRVKVFDNLDDALVWPKATPSKKPDPAGV
jgi:hypothetical protein